MNKSAVIFFDGECALCNSFVNRVLERDKNGVYQFAPLQGRTAEELPESWRRHDPMQWSVVLKRDDRLYRRSGAIFRILAGLGSWRRLWSVFLIIPPFLRDPVYDLISRRRYRWFGRLESCRLPRPGEEDKFLP